MDGLINLYENRKRMKIVLDGKDHFVKLQGTTDEPYFCGKDVCDIGIRKCKTGATTQRKTKT
jgi:hypothetical protein